MKKTIAILLLAVYLFNLGGYSLVFGYFIQQSDDTLVQQLDQNNYNEAQLSTISIPLHVPYIQNSGGFERVNGSVEYKGIQYNYVQRMVKNDTLFIQVMANRQKTHLVKEKSAFAGAVNDFAPAKKNNTPVAKKWSCTTEYNNCIAQYNLSTPGITKAPRYNGASSSLPFAHIATPGHPPRQA